MESNWVKIFESSVMHQANIVKNVLEEYDIISVIVNKKDSAYNNFGNYQIFVPSEDSSKAKEILHDQIQF
ncbi:MAG: DUF2007 domain-containing protein [Bacteroidota bacterium]|nr:DUF2007 domain-containing protein [Bacteroidota bacterium]